MSTLWQVDKLCEAIKSEGLCRVDVVLNAKKSCFTVDLFGQDNFVQLTFQQIRNHFGF